MPKLKPIDSELHKKHGWKLRTSMVSALNESVVPVLITEITKILPGYVFAFIKNGEGKFILVAIQGLHKDENLYVTQEGKPFFTPTPRYYHAYPFFLHDIEMDGKVKSTLMFDDESGLYREEPQLDKGEKRFISDDGKVTPEVENVLAYLTESEKWRKVTQKAVDALAEADVLELWTLPVENDDPKHPILKGFHKVSMEKLNSLDGEAMAKLQNAHALTIAYAQMFSMYRIETLKKLSELKKKEEKMEQTKIKAHNIDNVDAFFGDVEDEISFDWSKL